MIKKKAIHKLIGTVLSALITFDHWLFYHFHGKVNSDACKTLYVHLMIMWNNFVDHILCSGSTFELVKTFALCKDHSETV